MAYNTKAILTDVNQKPIPQFYDAVNDVYRQLTGQTLGGNNYGSNAVSWGKTAGGLFAPVAVNDSGHVQSNILSSALPSGAATQATLEAVLAKLSSDPATQTTLAAILAKIIAAPSTEAKQDALAALIGEAQASPTANTLLARLKSLEDKIDAITSGATPATVQLSGSSVLIPKTTLTTFVNADSIAARSNKTYTYPTLEYCDELYLVIQVDKQPWYILGSTPIMTAGAPRHTFPEYTSAAPSTQVTSGSYQRIVLFVQGGYANASPVGLAAPTTLDEAKKYSFPPQGLSGKTLWFYNEHDTDACTLTVQLLQVFRGGK
jgi:hypothetical protein